MGKIMVAVFLATFFLSGYFYATWNRGPEILVNVNPELHQIRCGDLYYFIALPELKGSNEKVKIAYNMFSESYCRHLEETYN